MTKDIYKLAREKTLERSKKFSCQFADEVKKNGYYKFSCQFADEVKKNGYYTMNCFYFGCLHQQDGTCPVLKGG